MPHDGSSMVCKSGANTGGTEATAARAVLHHEGQGKQGLTSSTD